MGAGMVASYYVGCLDGLRELVTEKQRQLGEYRAALNRIVELSKGVTEDESSMVEALEALIVIKGEANRTLGKYKGG